MENTNALSDMRYALGVWHFNEKLTNKANPCWFFYMSHLQTSLPTPLHRPTCIQ